MNSMIKVNGDLVPGRRFYFILSDRKEGEEF